MPAWFDGLLLGYEARFLAGAWLTAQLALASFALAVSIGMVGAIGKLSRVKALSGALSIYTLIVRGAPELLLILLIYFDLQHLLNAARDALGYSEVWIISPFWAGVAGIGVIYGAYMTETFRGAMLATPAGLAEAGRAFGMNAWSVFWRIVFPQMMRHALPGPSQQLAGFAESDGAGFGHRSRRRYDERRLASARPHARAVFCFTARSRAVICFSLCCRRRFSVFAKSARGAARIDFLGRRWTLGSN